MVSIADAKADLFGANLPSLDKLSKLEKLVSCSQLNKTEFAELIEKNKNNTLAAGIGLVMLGQYTQGAEILKKATDCKEKLMYLGWALQKLGLLDESIESLDKAAKQGADSLAVAMAKTAAYREAGELEKAGKQISACANFEKVSAEFHYQLGRLCDTKGDYEEAVKNYNIAIDLDPSHNEAIFHLAYTYDLRGDDEAAIDFYKQITKGGPVYINALLNLSVLYEDHGEYDKAEKCINIVLKSHPNHERALLFAKDISSSKVMVYDEEKERRKDRQNKILEIPISDFELSVRSRNCLKKMNIITLGDLLRITEPELLSYKNFGETSLSEIKKILDTKGLRLGMALEDKNAQAKNQIAESQTADEEILNKPLDDLELCVRARRAMTKLGVRTIGDLISKTEAELLGCKNFGVTSLNEIKEHLVGFGLSLRTLE